MNSIGSWTIADYFLAFYHYKWRAMLFLLGVLAFGAAYVVYGPRRYESESKLFVRVGRENAALDPTLTKGETMAVNASREEEMNSIVEHLRSRIILERALAVLKPESAEKSPEDRERELQGLQAAVYISSPRSSTVVAVQGKGDTPAEAQQVVSTVVDVYLGEHMRISRSLGSFDFLREQSARLNEQLETAQTALRDAKNQAGMASIEGRRTALENQISAVETQIHQVSASLAAAEGKAKAMRVTIESLPEQLLRQMVGGQPNDGMAAMRDRLFQLQMHQEEVHSKYTRPHPVSTAVDEQVEEVTGTLNREEPDRVRLGAALSAYDNANRASLAAEKESLQAQLAELHTALVKLNDDEVKIERLARQVRQVETNYLACAANLEEARKDQALLTGKITNVSVIQPATFAPLPVQPKKATTLLLALLAGLLGGALIAVFSEQAAQHSTEEEELHNDHEPFDPKAVFLSHDKLKTSSPSAVAAPRD